MTGNYKFARMKTGVNEAKANQGHESEVVKINNPQRKVEGQSNTNTYTMGQIYHVPHKTAIKIIGNVS